MVAEIRKTTEKKKERNLAVPRQNALNANKAIFGK